MHLLRKLSSKSPLIRSFALEAAGSRAFSVAHSFFGLHRPSSRFASEAVVDLSAYDCDGSREVDLLGTIIDGDGTIVTCSKVASRRAGKVKVTLRDDRSFQGTIVNADFYSDISIIKIDSVTALPTAKLGSSSKLLFGDVVRTLEDEGMIESLNRRGDDFDFLQGMKRYISTSIPLCLGSRGGPVFNFDGEVIGVDTTERFGCSLSNIVLPIDPLMKMIEHFRVSRRIVRPWLGLQMIDLDDVIVAHLKERDDQFPDVSRGVLVPWVSHGSPSYLAGLRTGDVIVEFEGRKVESLMEVIEIMGEKRGKPLEVVVKRPENETAILTVIPDEAKLIG